MGMLFVFAALLEYAFVNALSRKHAKEEHYKKTDNPQDVVRNLIDFRVERNEIDRTYEAVNRHLVAL